MFFDEGPFQDFVKWPRTALFHAINGGGAGLGMEVGCRRGLGVRDWPAGGRIEFGRKSG